jgi:phospholipase/carboxylesterase
MRTSRSVIAGIECRSVDWLREGSSPQVLVVLCHGFGAPGDDLVPLAAELVALRPRLAENVRFVFPAGSMRLDQQGVPGGRAWWHIDVNRLVTALERGEIGLLRRERPEKLPAAREALAGLVEELGETTGVPVSKFVLGGFSQGAMLAIDLALRLPERPGGLCVLSGSLLNEDEWRTLAAARGPLPVVQSHGYDDQILPFKGAEWLRDLFAEAGLDVDFLPFHGMHSIPPQALERLAALVERIAAA